MKKFIFDLDWTLYNRRDNIDETTTTTYYNSFKPKIFLGELLRELNEPVYIFTNGNMEHAIEVLTRLGLKKFFPNTRIITRDHIQYLKPHPDGYFRSIYNFQIHRDDEVYFFEDTPENLLTAKNFGWKTILVGDKKINNKKFIDFTFEHVEEALLFFLVKKKFSKNDFN
uniref:FCP1 homology domain-containing protein n=1 Tax=viral metagenome TaxID=1070528 RepID=A0A6C0B591_9ZZZZ